MEHPGDSTVAGIGRCGLCAIVGRPNVGKSTLLNRVLGQKLSITSRKPQTTRYAILGIKTSGNDQAVYIDTPGLRGAEGRALHRALYRAACRAIDEVHVLVLLIEALRWTETDQYVLTRIRDHGQPVILAINKVDRVGDKRLLLPFLDQVDGLMDFAEVIPISSAKGDNIATLEEAVVRLLPEGTPLYPYDQLTDRSERFFAAELIREKLLRTLGDEVPHRLSVVIDEFECAPDLDRICATIWVERSGQKRIVIGQGGAVLKRVGEEARLDMERMFGRKVFLRTWVKVKEHWSDDVRALQRLGLCD
ncbi:MAG: GTPase Era [Gammaproteobacteria bacterium]